MWNEQWIPSVINASKEAGHEERSARDAHLGGGKSWCGREDGDLLIKIAQNQSLLRLVYKCNSITWLKFIKRQKIKNGPAPLGELQ